MATEACLLKHGGSAQDHGIVYSMQLEQPDALVVKGQAGVFVRVSGEENILAFLFSTLTNETETEAGRRLLHEGHFWPVCA